MEPPIPSVEGLLCPTCGDEGDTNAFVYCVNCLGSVIHSILDRTATKTLLAIIRAKWHVGTFTSTKALSTFWPSVISEFRKYYSYHPGVSDADCDVVVKLHMARTMTQSLYEDKNWAVMRTEKNCTSLLEECPRYFDVDVWKSFCSHWCKKSFKKKSDINARNRRKLQVVHTTGAKPFNKLKEDLKQKYGEAPTAVQFWDESHKKKDTDEWASVNARSIGEWMREILASKEAAGESSQNWRSGISALLNIALGLPRVPANLVIRALQTTKKRRRQRNRRLGQAEVCEFVFSNLAYVQVN